MPVSRHNTVSVPNDGFTEAYGDFYTIPPRIETRWVRYFYKTPLRAFLKERIFCYPFQLFFLLVLFFSGSKGEVGRKKVVFLSVGLLN